MGSHDFGLSESNFSMSRKPGDPGYEKRPNLGLGRSRAATQQEKKKEKKEFYAFKGNKFTSYTGEDSGGENDDDGIEHN